MYLTLIAIRGGGQLLKYKQVTEFSDLLFNASEAMKKIFLS